MNAKRSAAQLVIIAMSLSMTSANANPLTLEEGV